MTKIHYQELQKGGLKAAYLTEIEGDKDALVRSTLNLHGVEKVPFANQGELDLRRPYVTGDRKLTIYSQPRTGLQDTTLRVQVPKKGPAVVGIHCRISYDRESLEFMINKGIIQKTLIPGLVPIESSRQDIPEELLRDWSRLN